VMSSSRFPVLQHLHHIGHFPELDVAVLGITHLSKGTAGRDVVERVTGSIAFSAVARVVLATVKAADTEAPRRLVRAKSNLGPDTGGFEYQLFGAPVPGHDFNAQRVDWGNALQGSARELMAIEQPDDDAGAADDAEGFLLEILASGPVATKDLKAAAAAHGHKWRTVERAKAQLEIMATKGTDGPSAGWSWQLPAPKTANSHSEDRHHE
jgi:putative DNA primase/helicase